MTIDDLRKEGFIVIEHERPVILLRNEITSAKTQIFKNDNLVYEYFRNIHQRIIHIRSITNGYYSGSTDTFIAFRYFKPHGTINEVWREYHNGISKQHYEEIYYGNDN